MCIYPHTSVAFKFFSFFVLNSLSLAFTCLFTKNNFESWFLYIRKFPLFPEEIFFLFLLDKECKARLLYSIAVWKVILLLGLLSF